MNKLNKYFKKRNSLSPHHKLIYDGRISKSVMTNICKVLDNLEDIYIEKHFGDSFPKSKIREIFTEKNIEKMLRIGELAVAIAEWKSSFEAKIDQGEIGIVPNLKKKRNELRDILPTGLKTKKGGNLKVFNKKGKTVIYESIDLTPTVVNDKGTFYKGKRQEEDRELIIKGHLNKLLKDFPANDLKEFIDEIVRDEKIGFSHATCGSQTDIEAHVVCEDMNKCPKLPNGTCCSALTLKRLRND